jgi:hypothetical protein
MNALTRIFLALLQIADEKQSFTVASILAFLRAIGSKLQAK